MSEPIVAIDVGTTKICTLVAELNAESGRLRIIGVGVAPSRGLRKGVVVNVEEATVAIKDSKEKAERTSGYVIEGAYVSVAGDHISSLNSKGVVAVSRGAKGITADDMQRALDSARAIAIPTNREVIHVIPRGFTLDGVDGVRDPIGMQGFRLEVEAHIVTAAVPSLHNLMNCVEGAGVAVNHLVLEPLASGEAVLRHDEKEAGVVMADIGGGTTDIAIFIDGSIWHSQVVPLGGWQYTNDLTIGLRAPFAVAEAIKVRHGSTLTDDIAETDMIDVAAFGENGHQPVQRRELANILHARAEEMFALIQKEVKRSGYDGMLPAGLVLTGGVAQLPGLKELGRDMLDVPVRIGAPHDLEGLTDTVSAPAYATAVGLLQWGLQRATLANALGNYEPRGRLQRMGGWLKNLLPQ
ncbi:MAG: cell division protein FtsA [Chloroflexota bacterium]